VVALLALVLTQVFLTFRGLSTPLGMEQAQEARELARGHGFQTRVIQPYAWRQMLDHGKAPAPDAIPDTLDPPLQPLVLAPVFKVFQSFWPMSVGRNLYFMDRVVACVAVFFFLAACGVTWSTARRLFDDKIAGWTVAAALINGLLWDVARSGLPQMMALFFFSIALWAFAHGLERVKEEHSATMDALLMGIMGACLALTHWMGVWLALGLTAVAVWHLRPRILAVLLAGGLPLLAIAGWAARNYLVCGDALGAVRPMVLSAISPFTESWLLRDFSGDSPPASAATLGRKILFNVAGQLHDCWQHFGGGMAALLFFVALLHPFKRPEVRSFARGLAVIWLVVLLAMAAVGLPEHELDANQVHVLFIPAMSMFGMAFLMVLWARMGMKTPHDGWWSDHGALALATAFSAVPLVAALFLEVSAGLTSKGQFAHWPPYLPGQITSIAPLTEDHELVMSDVPWAVAWYADRPGVWIPQDKSQFSEMRKKVEERHGGIAGFLLTPESLRVERPSDVFGGDYREWTSEIFRGVAFGFGVDIMAHSDFPYREFLPLARQPSGSHIVVEMVFLSDKKRWETSLLPVADSGSRNSASGRLSR